jgi:hypothetical protein
MEATMTTLLIQGIHNDFARKRGMAAVTWADDPEKNLGVVIPFNCPVERVEEEVAKAIKTLTQELEAAVVKIP